MNPEQRLLVVLEHLSVKFLILLLGTVIGVLHPKRRGIADGNRTLVNLCLILGGADFHRLLGAVLVFLLLGLGLLGEFLYHHVIIPDILRIDGLKLLLRIGLGQENLHRHKGAILVQHFPHPVFIGKLQAILRQIQSDFRTHFRPLARRHLKVNAALTLPVNGFRPVLP